MDQGPEERGRPVRTDPLLGAGVFSDGRHEAPMVLVDAELAPELPRGTAVAIGESETGYGLAARLAELAGESVTSRTVLLAVPSPEPQFAPGQRAQCAGRQGTFGAWVRNSAGERRILTAGHVVTGVGAIVHDARGGTAQVEAFEDPAMSPPDLPVADLAVLNVLSGVDRSGGNWTGPPQVARGGEPLTGYGAQSRTTHGEVLAFCTFCAVPRMGGQWSNTYMTQASMSVGGDSGGPVVHSDTGSIVGHIVGGAEDLTTWVQEIDYQLTRFGLTLL
jgi:hypothetical protein